MSIKEYIEQIKPLDKKAMVEAENRWNNIGKPLKSLGRLEEILIQIAGIQGTSKPDISKPVVCVMCADNGVVAQNVTQVENHITAIVAENMTKDMTSVCIMGKCIGADIVPVDIGIARDLEAKGVLNKKVMYGTKDMANGPAMSVEQTEKAIEIGIKLAIDLKNKGYNVILTGEMGIGNTTTSSAVFSVLADKRVEDVTGRGAGLSSEGLLRKIKVIKKAIELNKPNKNDPIDVLSKVGGLDIAGMVGLYIGGAIAGIPVVIDGFISGIAALLAKKIAPNSFNYMIPSHISAEPAGKMLLKELEVEPLVTAGMHLGEGTGAVTAVGVLQMGFSVYYKMGNFDEVNVEKYVELK